MKVTISKSEIKGVVSAPPSKSYTIRGLIGASLARGESTIIRPLIADDTEAARSVLEKIGVRISVRDSRWTVEGGDFHSPESELYCGDSAATLRFVTAICTVVPGECRLTAGRSLAKRPVVPLIEALRQLGVRCSASGEVPPVMVSGGTLEGGRTLLRGDISSQFVSALLLAAPLARKPVTIELTTPPESQPYILMTIGCLNKFGIEAEVSDDLRRFKISPQQYSPSSYEVERDWSSASYFLAAGAMAGEAVVDGLKPFSLQGDRKILDLLKKMGAKIRINGPSVMVGKGRLRAIQVDLNDCIDLLPTMMALAAAAEGTSVFTGIGRARLKESNRIAAMRQGQERLGIAVSEGADRISVTGSKFHGGSIDSMSDHRIAMAFGLLGLLTDGVVVDGAECVSKTYPEFWQELKKVGGKIEVDNR